MRSEFHLPQGFRSILPEFLRAFVPVFVLTLLAAASIGYLAIERLREGLRSPEILHVGLASGALDLQMARHVRNLQNLAFEEPPVQRALNQAGKDNSSEILEESFTSTLMRNPEYAQIRWIADGGKEIVRVDRLRDGRISVIAPEQLQDKSSRYYFRETLKLGKGGIYVSPLDLNIENERIVEPYEPMIRLATRTFREDGKPAGMFVLNVNAQTMLTRFTESSGGGDVVLLNQDGYWLKSPRPEEEWGFMFGSKETFGNKFPRAWALITASNEGQLETASGLWTWKVVRPIGKEAGSASVERWWVVSNVSHETLARLSLGVYLWTAGVTILLLALFAWVLWIKATERQVRLMASTQLRAKNQQLSKEIDEHVATQLKLEQALADLEHHKDNLEDLVAERTGELMVAKEASEAANVAKMQFLANMSHELRTPLHQINSLAGLLKRNVSDGTHVKRLGMIEDAVSRMTRVVDLILKLSALDAGKLPVVEHPIDIDALLHGVASMFLEPATAKGLQLEVAPFASPLLLAGDDAHIKSALACYVENAVRFTEAGRIDVKAAVLAVDEQSALICFNVEDTGIGIAPEVMPRVFDEFEQADNSSTREYGGTGVGLAIARKLAELLGGEAGCSSTPGVGSKFWFTVRLKLLPGNGAQNPAPHR